MLNYLFWAECLGWIVLIVGAIYLVAFILKDRQDKWSELWKYLKISKKKGEDKAAGFEFSPLPTASYNISETVESSVLSSKAFECSGNSLKEALLGIEYLKKLSEKQKTEEQKQQKSINIG